jgi:hypothetical protein
MAQRYSEWAQQQLDRAKLTVNPKARNDRLALAEYYSHLAEIELTAAERLKPAVKPSPGTRAPLSVRYQRGNRKRDTDAQSTVTVRPPFQATEPANSTLNLIHASTDYTGSA